MSSLQESLRKVLAVEGVRTAALIDIATGLIVRSVGKVGADLPSAAARVADEARTARVMLGASGQAGDLDEITVTMDSRLQISKVLRGDPGEGLLLFVDLERAKSNMGLASLRIGQLAPAVLA